MNQRLLKIIKISVIIIMAAFVISLTNNSSSEYNLEENQYITYAEDLLTAETLASQYNLELIDYNEYGIAVFNDYNQNEEMLISNGFSYNSQSLVSVPPWSSTEDPYLKDQYGLVITNTVDVWETTTGSSTLTIAIIDTGIDINHTEFEGRISPLSINTVTDAVGLNAVIDDYGHGTMVAGIIGANKDNSTGIAGITQETNLLVIKANKENEGTFLDSDIIEGMYYAVNNGADIINLSLGSSYGNSLTEAAVDFAVDNGVIVVGASGNDGNDELFYPASFENAISVSAVDQTYTIAEYSNHNSAVDISAPGSDIVTTSMDNGYVQGSGTSFAAPYVTGIIGLYLSLYPDATVDEIKAKLFTSALDLGTSGFDEYYGIGLVDANRFINATYHTITYNTSPGSAIDDSFVIDGDYLTNTEIPVLADQVFNGWYLDSLLTQPFVNTFPITSDLTLYASYTDAFHNVRFVTEGSSISDYIVAHESTFTVPTSTLEGYNFIGWYLDEDYTVSYTQEPVLNDLVLYAKFEEIIYYTVNYYIDGDIYQTDILKENELVETPTIDIYGYNFINWYLEAEYTNVYTPSNIQSDLNLFALYEPKEYSITTVVNSETNIQYATYLTTPEITSPTKEGYDFSGWYLDEFFTTRYFNVPIEEDITIYAKFDLQVYSIDIYIFNEHYDYLYYEPDAIPDVPNIIITGYDFIGWYIDSAFTNEYVSSTISEDIVLYGKYVESTYLIRFFDSDGSILSSQNLTYDQEITFPSSPNDYSTISFNYTFSSWSTNIVNATNDLDIYPIFDRTFIEGSVSLNPAIDTIYTGDTYIDNSISINDTSLTVTVDSNLDTSQEGKYIINYDIYDGDEFIFRLSRYVRVIESPEIVEITLNPGLTTIYVGNTFVDPGATTNIGTLSTNGTVDTLIPGIYYITYTVENNGIIYTKNRVVTVLDTSELVVIVQNITYKEEDENE